MKQHIIIFSGFNQRAVIAFCRFLHANNYKFSIIANNKKDTIFLSKYKVYVQAVRKSALPEMNDIIRCVNIIKYRHKVHKIIIAPTTEYLNQYFLNNRNSFLNFGCIIPLPGEATYSLFTNKLSFSDLCRRHEIQTPTRYTAIPTEYPYVIKPIRNISNNGNSLYPYIINDVDDINYCRSIEDLDNYYYEEYIPGKSYYLLFYISTDGHAVSSSQENLVQQDNGKSVVFAVSIDLHKKPICSNFKSLFKKYGFQGLIMVELKFYNNNYYAIEANPRFWGPSQLLIDGNSKILNSFLYDLHCSPTIIHPETDKIGHYYLWTGGFLQCILNGYKLKYHMEYKHPLILVLRSIFCDIYFKRDTIILFFYELTNLIYKRVRYGKC